MFQRTLTFRIPTVAAIAVLLSQPTTGVGAVQVDESPSPDTQAGIAFFESRIRPVLVRECYSCHSVQSGQSKGGLQLDTKSGLLLGGDSGPALVPGSLDDSPLWSAINHEDYMMPPRKQLSAQILEDFRQWIEMGAPDPRVPTINKAAGTVSVDDIERGRSFWSFVPPEKPDTPLAGDDWAINEIDSFVAAKLSESGIPLPKDAEPRVVLRRLYFDLIGLPPSIAEQESFLEQWQRDPDAAIAGTVDDLLARPQFGERWGRHWLDVARYAESSGREVNATYSNAWRYRDYVIDSFNQDKPYDQFVQEQIAGDLLPVDTNQDWAEHLIATGFLAIGSRTLNEQNPRQFTADLVDEQIDATTRVFLGVSVACARCHDHKYDPIPQTDYYAMAGIFRSSQTMYGTSRTNQNRRPSKLIRLPVADDAPVTKPVDRETLAEARQALDQLEQQFRELTAQRRSAGRRAPLNQQQRRQRRELIARRSTLQTFLDGYTEDGQPRALCMGVQPVRTPVEARLLVRGEVDQVGDAVPRGLVQVLNRDSASARLPRDTSGRLELAQWMASRDNPLTARVMVNRIWQHMIGQALVTSTNNFGATGTPPSHPELLDWMAVTFVDDGWSVKQMIRRIATSRAYRIASTWDEDHFQIDPDNRLLWRANARRLDAEAIRDSMLAVSGQLDLNRHMGSEVARAGETVARDGNLRSVADTMKLRMQIARSNPGMDLSEREIEQRIRRAARNRNSREGRALRELAAKQPSADPDARYRSVYLPVIRDYVPRALEVFDFAEPSLIVGTRETSSTPDQGLYMLNNPFVLRCSEALARRVSEMESSPGRRIQAAFLLCLGRKASRAELVASRSFLQSWSSARSDQSALVAMCQAIMASAEFRIVD